MPMYELQDAAGVTGPYSDADLKMRHKRGMLHAQMMIRGLPDGKWRPITDVNGLTFVDLDAPASDRTTSSDHDAAGQPPPLDRHRPFSPDQSEIACPYCSELIKASAKKCKHCGEFLDFQLRAEQKRAAAGPDRILGAFLSLVFPGLGQIYQGQYGAGILWLFFVVFGYLLFIPFGLMLHVVCIVCAAIDGGR